MRLTMNKENYLQIVASFLIALVLTIPSNVSIAYGAISKITVKGGEGIEGFAKSNDFLIFEVLAAIGNETINREQVKLGTTIFDNCAKKNNLHECTLRVPSAGTQTFEPRAIPFTINLFKGNGAVDDSKTGTILIDNKAPQLKLALSKSKFSSRDAIVLNYEATDAACNDAACSGKCIGIEGIDFSSDAGFKDSIEFKNLTSCSAKNSITIEIKKFKDGKNTISAKARDKFDQISQQASVEFFVDTKGPEVLENTFVIIRKGVKLNTYSPHSVPVEVSIDIEADDLDPNSVFGDLTLLNPSLKKAKASCSPKGSLFTCKWNIDLNPGTAQADDKTSSAKAASKSIVINASDLLGNSESATISKTLTLDDKGPVVQSLATGIEKNGKIYARANGNTFTAVLSDVTGIIADEVILHLDGSKLQAKSCKKESNLVCKWEVLSFSAPKTSISIQQDTVDILLNPVSELKTLEVVVDDKAPVLNKINISAVGSLTDALPDLFKVGDKFAVLANVTEENELTATADFSRFVEDAKQVAGSCEKVDETTQLCKWLSNSITNEGTGKLKFNFSDPAGNELIFARELRVLGLETSPAPDFWKNSFVCSPKSVDRQLGTFVNQRSYCSVKLEPKTSGVTALFISPAECKGEGVKFVQGIDTINNEPRSLSPIIKITLKKDELKANEINLSCAFGIISKVNNLVTKNPEFEEANISIKLYNFPLGEVSDIVQKKIDDAKNSAKEFRKTIGILSNFAKIAKTICQMIHVFYTIVASWYVLTAVLSNKEIACYASPGAITGACEIIYGLSVSSCSTTEVKNVATENAHKGLNKFCDFVTCRQALWGNSIKAWLDKAPGLQHVTSKDGKPIYDPVTGKLIGGRSVSGMMDPNNNLITASLFGCIPGIIAGLDKFRQIQCLYADCLQNSVAKDGLPTSACDNLKSHATCKYVTTEIFSFLPWTAVFDHFASIIKNAMSNPFAAAGVVASLYCSDSCAIRADGGAKYQFCRGVRLFALVGDAASNVKNIIDEGSFWKPKQDYCKRIEEQEEQTNSTTTT